MKKEDFFQKALQQAKVMKVNPDIQSCDDDPYVLDKIKAAKERLSKVPPDQLKKITKRKA